MKQKDESEERPRRLVESWPSLFRPLFQSESMRKHLLRDCAAAATARARLTEGDHSHGTTFWVAGRAPPDGHRNAHRREPPPQTTLERLALDVFRFHVRRLVDRRSTPPPSGNRHDANGRKIDASNEGPSDEVSSIDDIDWSNSGVEWWTLSMDGRDGGVGWHWDKDYHAESEEDRDVHPSLATVTYFSDIGAPTIVVPRTSLHPHEGRENECIDDDRPIARLCLSRPVPGKHIAFDGRLLHGAPTDVYDEILLRRTQGHPNGLTPKKKKGGPSRLQRATFLANIWINHKPRDAVCIDASLKAKLSKFKVAVNEDQWPGRRRASIPLEINVTLPPRSIKARNASGKNGETKKKSSGKEARGVHNNKSALVETESVVGFEWELDRTHSFAAELPVEAIGKTWGTAESWSVSWAKGTRRPYIAETALE